MTVALTQTRSAAPLFCGAATQSSSDEVLMTRIAGGDHLAMRTLFARYQVRLYRWIVRIVGNEELAEELLNDVFLDVWRQAASFKARSSVSTWLLSIARFKALSARHRRIDEQLDEELIAERPDPMDDPEMVVQKKDEGEVLRNCLGQLSAVHREVIDLVYYHGKSGKEVAEIVRIPEPTVKTRTFYARKKLAEMVSQLRN